MKAGSLKLAVVLITVTATVGGIAIALHWFNPMYGAETEASSLSNSGIEQLAGFRFPAEATNVHSRYVEWQDYDLWVRFDLPVTAREKFIASLLPSAETEVMMGEISADDRMPWWTPPTGSDVEEIQRHGNGIRQHVILDERDAQHLRIYVAAHNDDDSALKSPSTAPSSQQGTAAGVIRP
jgi:hypothetical protein